MRRRSLASSATAPPASDDSLFHVGQRLDALAADDDHAVFYFSRVATPSHTRRVLLRSSTGPQPPPPTSTTSHARARAATLTTRRRRHRRPLLSRVVGLSAFYARAALLVALAWAVAAFGVVATTAAVRATPSHLLLASIDRQIAHELAALSAGTALGGVLGGSLADHYGRRPVLLAFTACGAVALVLAGGLAWSHGALLAARGLQGLALGAQLVLFPIVLGELSAQRRRGRVVVSALAGVPLGALLAILTARPLARAVGWRVLTAALLGGAQTLVFALLAWRLRESPRFLAAIGRVEPALALVQAIERAHGIDRNARIPLPSSLFEPPAQQLDLSEADDPAEDDDDHDHRPSLVASTPIMPPPTTSSTPARPRPVRRRRTSAALTPRMVSLGVSLRKRWHRILFCAPYAKRSLGLTVLWMFVAGGLSTTLGAASRFTRDDGPAMLSTYVAIACAVGLLASAVAVDRCGRVPLFLLSLLVSSLATTLVGMHLFMELHSMVLLGGACALLAFASVVSLSAAFIWTLESYGVLIRATGMGLAFTGMGVGAGCGQWLAWSPWLSLGTVAYALWGVAGTFIVLAFATWVWGVETRGLDDADAVVMPPTDPITAASSRPTLERDNTDKLPALHQQMRTTYHSKDTTQDNFDDEDQVSGQMTSAQRRRRRRRDEPGPTGASANSNMSTFIGSSRTSSARFSSVRFSQRALSSDHTSGHRGTRGSSLSRQQYGSAPTTSSSYRRREASLSRGDQTPPFVIRRSSLARASGNNGAYAQHHSDGSLPRSRRVSGRRLSGRRSNSGHDATREPSIDLQRRRLQDQQPRSSFESGRFSFSNLTTSLPGRLDPHSVRERLGRRSSDSSSDDLGIALEHDVMTIDIDPYEDDDHSGFVTVPTPMPMLG